MTHTTRALIVSACLGISSLAFAQQAGGGKGLDALSDDRLLNELAGRNLKTLLDRQMAAANVPAEKRAEIVARSALSSLKSSQGTMGITQRRQLIDQFVGGLPTMLPSMQDPKALISDANILIDNGIREDMTLIEYWGENSRTQARLRPVAEAVDKMLNQASTSADATMNRLVENWNDANAKRWGALDEQKGIAENTRFIIAYPLALSIDKADPKRKQVAEAAIEYLKPFDDKQNPEQSFVRFMLGKLNLTLGNADSYKAARGYFDGIIKEGDQKNAAAQYEARTFRAVTELLDGNLPEAQKQVDSLATFATSKNLNDPGYKALNETLKYRVLALEAEKAADPAVRERVNNQAAEVLTGLLKAQPELKGIIFEQLATRVDPATPVDRLDGLLLQAVISKGEAEYVKKPGEAFDKAALQRGADAARQLATRKGTAGVDDKLAETATYTVPFFLEKLGDEKAAANAYLDYVAAYKGNTTNAPAALNNAIALVGKLRSNEAQLSDPEVVKAYERVLETAVNPPFNRREFAFEYGGRLLGQGKPQEALAMFAMVPADNRSFDLAQYFSMVANNSLLDQLPPTDPKRPALLKTIQGLADKVNASADKLLTSAKTDADKTRARTRLANTRLLAAKLAFRDQKDAPRAIELLTNFEQAAAGLRDEKELLGQALLIRVQSLIEAGNTSEAATALQDLSVRDPKNAGGIVYSLLRKLQDDVTRAEAAGNAAEVDRINQTQSAITPALVAYAARPDTKEEVRKNWYVYSVFDADTQRRAAEGVTDPGKRKEQLDRALTRYKELETGDNFKKFQESLTPEQRKVLRYDRQVVMGVGQVAFASGNFEEARGRFGRLLNDQMVGTPIINVRDDAGNVTQRDNDQYWEALYKFIRSRVELKDTGDATKNFLRAEYYKWGDRVGGQRWKKDFEALRVELIPDFDPSKTLTTPAPTTQAASAG